MGCDIHLYVERREGGKWVKCEGFVSDYYKEGDPYFGTKEFSNTDEPYGGRNYDLFAMLADVRNGYGFAGCDTGDGFKPIAAPRGLPKDVSLGVAAKAEGWEGDGHSYSWLTLAELQAYDFKGQKTKHRGVVSATEFKEFERDGHPSSWGAMVSGPGVKIHSPEEMRKLISEDGATDKDYCAIEWEESYYASAGNFVTKVMPQLAERGNPEDVRIVFWFDN